jgi:hypothetical protein
MNSVKSDSQLEGLYRFGGTAAFLIALLLIGEVVVYASIPDPATVIEYFELFIDNPLAGLLIFDLLGMVAYVFFVPLVLALYVALRRDSEAVMLTAIVLFWLTFRTSEFGGPPLWAYSAFALVPDMSLYFSLELPSSSQQIQAFLCSP